MGKRRRMEGSSFEDLIKEEDRHVERQQRHDDPAVVEEAREHAEVQVETTVTLAHVDEVLRITMRALDPDDLFTQILDKLQSVLEADAVSVLLLVESEKSLYFRASKGLEDAVVRRIRIPTGTDHSGKVAAMGRSMQWTRLERQELFNVVHQERGVRSLAGVPIFGENRVLGVLEVVQTGDREIEPSHITLLEVCAHHIGTAIERTDLVARLRDAQRAAEQANTFKTTLIHMLTHDLKTPLTAVMLPLEMLERGVSDPKKLVQKIGRNLRLLQLMMDDFLDMARIDADRFTLHPQKVQTETFLQEVVDLFEPQATGGQIKLHLSGPSLEVELDPRRLRQVLANLVSNAIRYNEPGGEAFIHAERRDDEVWFVVRDTGRGMTPEQLRRAAQPFSQVHASRREQEGTGLGLHLCRLVLEQQGGRLVLESQGPGLGTTAAAVLPA